MKENGTAIGLHYKGLPKGSVAVVVLPPGKIGRVKCCSHGISALYMAMRNISTVLLRGCHGAIRRIQHI